jgi:hypothetical protein
VDGVALAHLLSEEILNKADLGEESLDEALFFGLSAQDMPRVFPYRIPAFGLGHSSMEVAHQFISLVELLRTGRADLVLLVGVRAQAPPGPDFSQAREALIRAKSTGLTRPRLDEAVLQSIHRYASFTSRVEFLDALQPFFLPEKDWQLVAEDRLSLAGVTAEQLSLKPPLSSEVWDFLSAWHFAPPARGGCGGLLLNETSAARHAFGSLVEVGDLRFLSFHGEEETEHAYPAVALADPGSGADVVFTSCSTAVEEAAFAERFKEPQPDLRGSLGPACEQVNPWGSELAYGSAAGCGLLRRAGFLAAYLVGENRHRGLLLENISPTAGLQMEFIRP